MASKAFIALFSPIYFVLLSIPISPTLATRSNPKSPNAFQFLEHLKGCHKDDNLKNIYNLKKYLENFGYLSCKNSNNSHARDDVFDELLESAIKTYQKNYHLDATGVLDTKTVAKMMKPRCGFPDISNGTNWMQKKNHRGHGGSESNKHFHSVSHYAFLPGNPKWQPSQYSLTYAFLPGTPIEAITPVDNAFRTWAANSHFSFSRAGDANSADLKISFDSRDHGDGSPFDGPGGVLAHAFAPDDGRFHYDADEQWSVGAMPDRFDLETVALHEIGHLLGLGHSEVEGAIMFSGIPSGTTKGLHADDIQGIRALYGSDRPNSIPLSETLRCFNKNK